MNQLTETRKSKGLTMSRLSEISGISANTISTYEKNPPQRPSRKVLIKLSEALGEPVEELIKVEKKKTRKIEKPQERRETKTTDLSRLELDHLSRLVNNEIRNIQQLIIETAQIADVYPALNRSVDHFSSEIEQLELISDKLTKTGDKTH